MHINRISPELSAGASGKGVAGVGSDYFQQLLETHMRSPVPVEAPGALAGVMASSPVDPALKVAALELSDRAVADLESYQQGLGNLDLKSKDLEPHVAALEERVIGLLELREQLPPDEPLARVIDRVCTSCYLETVKYRRGDYSV